MLLTRPFNIILNLNKYKTPFRRFRRYGENKQDSSKICLAQASDSPLNCPTSSTNYTYNAVSNSDGELFVSAMPQ